MDTAIHRDRGANFLLSSQVFNKVTLNANWTTTLLVYFVCVSSTLDLFVLFTLQRKLCIAFQGAMSFSPGGKTHHQLKTELNPEYSL
jgi:hypothetical protein